jgi:hypothetical protein
LYAQLLIGVSFALAAYQDVTDRAVNDLVHKYQSRSTPTLVIGEEVMIGFDPDRLDELMRD